MHILKSRLLAAAFLASALGAVKLVLAASLLVVAADVARAVDVGENDGEGDVYKPKDGKWFDGYKEYWNELKGDKVRCATSGNWQSPINIQAKEKTGGRLQLSLEDGSREVRIAKNEHTMQFDVVDTSRQYPPRIGAGQNTWRFLQFHFHHPSEHLLEGQRFPMEMHLVHGDQQGNPKAVVAVFLKVGKVSDPMAPFDSLKSVFKKPADVGTVVLLGPRQGNLYGRLLPWGGIGQGGYTYYRGSLTTPTCDGNIDWFVLHDTWNVSKDFVEKFTEAFPMNARWPQTLEGRKLQSGRGHPVGPAPLQ